MNIYIILAAAALLLLGKGKKNVPSATAIKVASWNIQTGCSAPMKEGTYSLTAQMEFLGSLQANIICLQEVDSPDNNCKCDKELTASIPALLGMTAASHGPLRILVGGGYRLGSSGMLKGFGGKCMRAEVITPGGAKITVYNLHGNRFDKKKRTEQIQKLATLAAKESLPTIVAGDFNECRLGNAFSGFVSCNDRKNTFTTKEPRNQDTIDQLMKSSSCGSLQERIDYIFANKKLKCLQSHTEINAGPLSDHYPITATLVLVS